MLDLLDAPTVMWRMRRADGQSCHAVIGPCAEGAVVVWFLNGRPLGFRVFGDWANALRWSDELQAPRKNLDFSELCRLVPEYDDTPV